MRNAEKLGEGATPPQAEPGDEIARARTLLNRRIQQWGAGRADGWLIDRAVDALIAAVRQGHAPRR